MRMLLTSAFIAVVYGAAIGVTGWGMLYTWDSIQQAIEHAKEDTKYCCSPISCDAARLYISPTGRLVIK